MNLAHESGAGLRQPLPPGTGVGPYRILSLLASGGMGDVYRARDERLARDVALKVLPGGLTDDRERVERFAQEAKSASALNHPHIVTIYEIGEARPTPVVQSIGDRESRPRAPEIHYIAMELVDGVTLRERMEQRPPLEVALELLAQTAEGLGKAHAAGIVHRDLKPDNVMVSNEGYAKIVDFGLAKLVEPARGWNPLGADSPTMRALTQQGELIGTAGYMSPEQILGKAVDQRADVFSFGCMIHEVVTGRRPFDGDSFVDTLHEVLHGAPPPIRHPDATVQYELQRIAGKCLEKDREQRYQSIRDVALDLRALRREMESPTVVPFPRKQPPQRRRVVIGAYAAAVAAVVLIAGGTVWRMSAAHSSSKAEVRPRRRPAMQLVTNDGHVEHLAVAPDGRFLAYVTRGSEDGEALWLQQLANGGRVVVAPAGDASYYAGLTFSSDSNALLATRYQGTIYGAVVELPILGGNQTAVVRDADTRVAVSPDGSRIAVTRDVLDRGESHLLVAARDGSHERVLTKLPLPEGAMSPAWSPDGMRIAVAHGQSLYTIDALSGAKTQVPATAWHGWIRDVSWSGNDELLISAADEHSGGRDQLLRVDVGTGAVTNVTDDDDDYAEPHAIGRSIAAIRTKKQATIWSATDGAAPQPLTRGAIGSSDGLSGVAWTRDGRVVYTSAVGSSVDLWIANADGTMARQLTSDDVVEARPVVNGDVIIYLASGHGTMSVRRMNVDGSQPRELAAAKIIYDFAVAPDGRTLVYAAGDETTHASSLFRVPMTGGVARPIGTAGVFLRAMQVTPDGRTVVFAALDQMSMKLFRVALDGGTVTPLLNDRATDAAVSPDGALVACSYDMHENRAKVALVPAAGGAPQRVLDLHGRQYRWTPDGKAIAFIRKEGDHENLAVQPLAGGEPQALTHFTDGAIANFGWSADGRRLVVTQYVQTRDVVLMKD